MAKVNKSQEIRNYFEKHGFDHGPTEVAEALGGEKKGYTVSLVSNVKTTMQQGGTATKKKPKKRGPKAGTKRRRKADNGSVTVEQLRQVNALVEELGGVDNVEAALKALGEFK